MNMVYTTFSLFLLLLCWFCWRRFRRKIGGPNGTYNFVYDSAPKKIFPDIIRLFFFALIFISINSGNDSADIKDDIILQICVFSVSVLVLVLMVSVFRKFVFRRIILSLKNYRTKKKKDRLILNDPNLEKINLEYRYEVLRNTEEIGMYAIMDATKYSTIAGIVSMLTIQLLHKRVRVIGVESDSVLGTILKNDSFLTETVADLRKCLYISIVFHIVFTIGHLVWVVHQIKGSREKGKSIASKFIQSETDY